MSWDKYISKYSNKTVAFSAPVGSTLPEGRAFDMNGRELPTPYSLFSEWCTSYLSGDWTITETRSSFIICTTDDKDTEIIQGEFNISGSPKITIASKTTYPIDYSNSQYAALAGDLGYVL